MPNLDDPNYQAFLKDLAENLSAQEAKEEYQKSWQRFAKFQSVGLTVASCISCLGPLDIYRANIAAFLFNKLLNHGMSLLRICPDPLGENANFDPDSAAAISRVLYENYLVFFYLAVDSVNEEEWNARDALMRLRDVVSRQEIRTKVSGQRDVPEFKAEIEEIAQELRKNSYFTSMSEGRQTDFLKGKKSRFLSFDELDIRIGELSHHPAAIYKVLSSSVHTTPGVFRRVRRLTWEESQRIHSFMHSGLALDFARYYVMRSTNDMKSMLPQWKDKLPEVEQAREKEMRRRGRSDLIWTPS